jgi:hypothetical protein
MMCGVRSGQTSLVGLRDKKAPHLRRQGAFYKLLKFYIKRKATSVATSFAAKINALLEWAMSEWDVV